MRFNEYQLKIIRVALKSLIADYDKHDLEELMYSNVELESEISLILGEIRREHVLSEYRKDRNEPTRRTRRT